MLWGRRRAVGRLLSSGADIWGDPIASALCRDMGVVAISVVSFRNLRKHQYSKSAEIPTLPERQVSSSQPAPPNHLCSQTEFVTH